MASLAHALVLLVAVLAAPACLSSPERGGICGDGKVDPDSDEECDDGNDSDVDGCLGTCTIARCGDGVIRRDVETCDSLDATLDCTSSCLVCPDDDFHRTDPMTGNCYTRTDFPSLGWPAAEQTCVNAGSHLMTLTSAAERSLMADWASWIGLSELRLEGEWAWVTGEAFRYTSWAPDEPIGATEHCVHELLDQAGWNNLDCSIEQIYACETEAWVVGDDGHAYRLGDDLRTWSSARASCEAMGAHLLVIETEEEHLFLLDRFEGEAWIGARFRAELDGFGWQPDQPLTFTAWDDGEPSDLETDDCVSRDDDGNWDSDDCETELGWICEIDD